MKIYLYAADLIENIVKTKTTFNIVNFSRERVKGIIITNKDKVKCLHKVYEGIDLFTPDEFLDVWKDEQVYVAYAPLNSTLENIDIDNIETFINRGISVINGTHHDFKWAINLRDGKNFDRWMKRIEEKDNKKILTLGTDYSNGKMFNTVMYHKYLKEIKQVDVNWAPTGQTGIMIKGSGIVFDSLVTDYAGSILENFVNHFDNEYVIVEGQASFNNRQWSYGPFAFVTILRPQYILLTHKMNQKNEKLNGDVIKPINELIDYVDMICKYNNFETKFIGISINSSEYSYDEYIEYKNELSKKTGLPVVDPYREGIESYDKFIKI